VRFWRPIWWPGLELMSAHWVRHSFSKHFHDCYTLGFNEGGCGTFDCRGTKNRAAPGTLNLIAPGETHTGQAAAADGWLYRDLYIDSDCMAELVGYVGFEGVPEFHSAVVKDGELAGLFRVAFDLMVRLPPNRLEQEYHLLFAIRRLCVRHTTPRLRSEQDLAGDRSKISRIREYLHAHYEQTISTNDLARLVGWSCYHLIRAFHQQTGLPPHAYQKVVRVNEAKRLLRGGAAIADAAAACGFYDQSHMHHMFRRSAGATPGQYASL
jgi:AraC-like DNA-binding protein